MKKIVVILLATALSLGMSAQPKDVVLVVTGDGTSKEVATNNALRSAVEQAFGVFVSANTEILNDELVRDEIATITSGNIKSFKELSVEKTPSGDWFVSLQAEVSIGNLVSYAKSHGSSAEFAGNTFAANLRMRELNKQNEIIALQNLAAYVKKMSPQMFDFKLTVDDSPMYVAKKDAYVFSIGVEVFSNEVSYEVFRTICDVLDALKLSPKEEEEYKNTNNRYNIFTMISNYRSFWDNSYSSLKFVAYALRSENDILLSFTQDLREAITDAIYGFRICATPPLSNVQFRIDDIDSDFDFFSYDFEYNFYYQSRSQSQIIRDRIRNIYDSGNKPIDGEPFTYRDIGGLTSFYEPFCNRELLGCSSTQNRWSGEFETKLSVFIPLRQFKQQTREKIKDQTKASVTCVVPVFVKQKDLPHLTGFEVRRLEEDL